MKKYIYVVLLACVLSVGIAESMYADSLFQYAMKIESELTEDDPQYYFFKGLDHVEKKEYLEAITSFTNTIKLAPDAVVSIIVQGITFPVVPAVCAESDGELIEGSVLVPTHFL